MRVVRRKGSVGTVGGGVVDAVGGVEMWRERGRMRCVV